MLLDGKPFQMVAGEMHPSRIPHQYWDHRIKMAKSMGMNTIAFYIFWNAHEMQDGSFDYATPQNNLSKFVELCHQNGLFVAVRAGPYICGEWDFGGLPVYFLANRSATIRTISDKFY